MGTLGGGNGDWPQDGQRDGLPGLPPEWGPVVVPDDLSELAAEADEVRRELRRESRQRRWRRRFGLPATAGSDEPSIGLPLLIMAIAVVATLTSLFAVAWPQPDRTPHPAVPTATVMQDITLQDAVGQAVRLQDTLPAVVLLVDACECDQLIAEVAEVAGSHIKVLVVDSVAPDATDTPPPTRVRLLVDRETALRKSLSQLATPAAGTAAVALVSSTGEVIKQVASALHVEDFKADLATLS